MKSRALLLFVVACAACHALPSSNQEEFSKPNVVLIFTDDQGFGDLSCYGHPTIYTPHVDALAAGGTRLTQFYVAAPVCSPSRAALLTGCYPKRVGMHDHVVFPEDNYGLHSDEVTLAELLRQEGYATGCFGKWHLGHWAGLLPTDQGFDTFFGVPYSNDMSQMHRAPKNNYAYRLPLMRDAEVIEWEPDQHLLTKRTTDAALSFIEANSGQPFFAYLPYSMPHIPIYASAEFEGKSQRGLYGDVIEEIDSSVGRVVATLERLGVLENTLILFSSDNGPWLPFKLKGGSAGLLRGGKGTNWEGGQRVPLVAHWPRAIPAGQVCRELATSMDLLPTIAAFAGATLPPERELDGHDISDLFCGKPGATSPTDSFLYYTSHGELAGIRRGPWKLLLDPEALYQVEHDVSEKWNVVAQHPELAAELRQLARQRDQVIGVEARPVQIATEMLFDPTKPKGPVPR